MTLATLLGWKMILPVAVQNESTKKRALDPEIVQAIDTGLIVSGYANPNTFDKLKRLYGNLGDGELESLAIVSDCEDKTYSQYRILSEDDTARAHGESMGMIIIGILPLLSSANNHGLLPRTEALQYLKRLRKNNFTPSSRYAREFIDSLV